MSKKFRDKILKGSGYSNKKFECEYGLKLLKAMGWKEEEGLGASGSGRTECVQVQRREEVLGLGADTQDKFQWNNTWWEDQYNNTMSTLKMTNFEDSDSEKNTSDTSEEPEHDERNQVTTKGRKNRLNFVKKIDEPYQTSDSSSEDEEDYKDLIKKSKKIQKVAVKETKKEEKSEKKVSISSAVAMKKKFVKASA